MTKELDYLALLTWKEHSHKHENRSATLCDEQIEASVEMGSMISTYPNTAHIYGQSKRIETTSGFGPGGRSFALGNLVLITQFATERSPMLRNAIARTPHANPTEPLNK